jgi:NAD(P)-dependent dehydrogenase (short-subunit alcohol dehydrogenase family)
MDLELTGKVAIVSGGSRGIGKAVARVLAQEGADVAIVARDMAVAGAVAKELAHDSGRKVEAFKSDTGKDDAVRDAVAAIAAAFGRVDILVNSAANPASQARAPKLAEVTDDPFFAEMNTKVLGYLRMAREAAPYMKREGWGRIINISGLNARMTGNIIGSIRNVGVAALTKNLADELGSDGICVTCVHPGFTRTEKTFAMVERLAGAAGITLEEQERRLASRVVIGRMPTAEEVANVVAFLASPKSVAITGDSIAAGGGTPGSIYY